MERESFEDEYTADILNKYFICIKVDKEERPDIDNIYMNVCYMLNGNGGWPLSIFMDTNQKPFYAGTYFPNKPIYNIPTFVNILLKINQLWVIDREQILKSTSIIMDNLNKEIETENINYTEKDDIEIFKLIKERFDTNYGGYKGNPKFPMPQNIYFLLRFYLKYKDSLAMEMAEKTLINMYKGGIYDHIGYGFCRYSVDEKWLVPHFEKMLYDNALLVICYAEMYQLTKKDVYRTIVENILAFIEREMTSEDGVFYTAIDADSEGVEGKYYIWDKEEILDILGSLEGENFCKIYNVTECGNFEGKNIPNLIGNELYANEDFNNRLLENRIKRKYPHVDDKILVGQNGMMIWAYSYCGRILKDKSYINKAERAISFIKNNMIDKNGRLLTAYRNGGCKIKAYLEDYSYFICALIETYTATGNENYIDLAKKLNDDVLKLFHDRYVLYISGIDSENLIKRSKNSYDNAYPSASSICLYNVFRLGIIFDNFEYLKLSEEIFKNEYNISLNKVNLIWIGMLLNSEHNSIIIVGDKYTEGYNEIKNKINNHYLPFTIIKYVKKQSDYKLIENRCTVYICKGNVCLPPISTVEELSKIIY